MGLQFRKMDGDIKRMPRGNGEREEQKYHLKALIISSKMTKPLTLHSMKTTFIHFIVRFLNMPMYQIVTEGHNKCRRYQESNQALSRQFERLLYSPDSTIIFYYISQ